MNCQYLKRFLMLVAFSILSMNQPLQAMTDSSYPVTKNITMELKKAQPGDWVFFDVDDTLLIYSYRTGIAQVKDINPEVKETIKDLRLATQGSIKFYALTARNSPKNVEEDLNKLGYDLDGIVSAPEIKLNMSEKGDHLVTFIKSQPDLPQGIWFFDDKDYNLKDVQGKLESDYELSKIPLKLYQVKFYRKF